MTSCSIHATKEVTFYFLCSDTNANYGEMALDRRDFFDSCKRGDLQKVM